MYEHMTYGSIMQRMLDRVPNSIDKREGGLIYSALAPAAWELAGMYAELDVNMRLSFADTASGEYLTRRAAEFGVNRRPATKARRRGRFYNAANQPMNIPPGSRYSMDNVNYTAVSPISAGEYVMESEAAGIIGNQQFGALLPIQFVPGLARAELTDILVPGEDEESDEELRQRYYRTVNEPPFGGNAADYRQRINAIPGVGATKVYPVWQGGGTVKCTLIASDWSVPSSALVNEVQTIMDPTVHSGQGIGQAPIGHQVTIAGVAGRIIDVETTLTLAAGVTPGQVQADVEAAVAGYLLELRQDWAEQQQLVVRTAQLDARMLTVPGIEDVGGTEINEAAANLTLEADEIPLAGAVTIHG